MSNIKALAAITPIVGMLQHQKMSDADVEKHLMQLNQQIELGTIWSLMKSRGDEPAALATLSPEQKEQYINSFSTQEYRAAMDASAEQYISDYIATILEATDEEDQDALLAMIKS